MRRSSAAVVLCITLVGCAPSIDDQIVGEWSATNMPWTIALTGDGKVTMQTVGPPTSGTFALDGKTLKMNMNDGKRFQASVQIVDDEMTLTDPDGSKSTFKRVRR